MASVCIPRILVEDIDTKFNTLMRDPYYVRISADNMGLEGIHHFYYTVKTDKVKHQIFCNKISRLVEILSNVAFEQCLVFSNYQTGAEEISVSLTREGFSNQLIAGNMAQRDRSQAMSDFRECRFRVLISTDVTARGIDNEHVDLVINMDLPVNTLMNPDPHTYLHRAGRAGRFGKYGSSISIIASQKEHMFIQDLADKYQVEVKEGPPYDQITDLLKRSKDSSDPVSRTLVKNGTSSDPNSTSSDPNSTSSNRNGSADPAKNDTVPDRNSTPVPEVEPKTDNPPKSISEPELEEKVVDKPSSNLQSKGSSHDFLGEDLPGSIPEIRSSRSSKGAPTPDSVFNGWSGSVSEHSTVSATDLNSLRSSVPVHQKSRGSSPGADPLKMTHKGRCETDGKQTIDKDTALSSLGSLGKITGDLESALLPGSEDENASVFNFSSQDVNHYNQEDSTLFVEALPLMQEEEPLSSNPSTCGSQKPPSDNETGGGAEISRSRRGSKNQKKAKKPPKTLNMASPKGQSNRRSQSAAAEFANSNILSPHTPKWRSEAVSSSGCIIHSKAINVKFLLENYLCMKYEFTDKEYENDYRGFFPAKCQILKNASTAMCEVPNKSSLSRYVSQGFVANSEHDPLLGKRTPPQVTPPKPCYEDDLAVCDDMPGALNTRPGCQSTSSMDSASRQPYAQHCCHRPAEIPHLYREQSKDSGVSFYSSAYHYPPFCSAPSSYGPPPCRAAPQCAPSPPCGASPACAPSPPCGAPPAHQGPPYYWWHYMPPPMCGSYPSQPPPTHFCSNHPTWADFSRHFSSVDSHSQFNSTDSARHTPSGYRDPRHCSGPDQMESSWSCAWEKAWEQ